MEASQNQGLPFVNPHNQDRSILGSIWGAPFYGNPNMVSGIPLIMCLPLSRSHSCLGRGLAVETLCTVSKQCQKALGVMLVGSRFRAG